jgi:hypothetical protein
MRKVKIRTTAQQREGLTLLRRRLAEQGYLIFEVASWYRRHRLDFLATPKRSPLEFVVVRPMRNGSLSVRPYSSPVHYRSFRELLGQIKAGCPIRWSNRQLPLKKGIRGLSFTYLPRSAEKEYARLMG